MAKWEQKAAVRNDLKNLLKNTQKFAEMYLDVLKERKDLWTQLAEKQKEKEKASNG